MSNQLDSDVQSFLDLGGGLLLLFALAALVLWILMALMAAIVAPDDRTMHFFWCTLLLLGPVGVVAALVAQPRVYDDETR